MKVFTKTAVFYNMNLLHATDETQTQTCGTIFAEEKQV